MFRHVSHCIAMIEYVLYVSVLHVLGATTQAPAGGGGAGGKLALLKVCGGGAGGKLASLSS